MFSYNFFEVKSLYLNSGECKFFYIELQILLVNGKTFGWVQLVFGCLYLLSNCLRLTLT